eukprot:403359449
MTGLYKVHYFPGYGRAEAMRMLMSHAGIQYGEQNYNFPDLPELKIAGKIEFGQLPVLEKNGKFYSQTFSILRYLGQVHGYYPEDPYQAYLADSILDSMNDIMGALYKGIFNPVEELKVLFMTEFYEKVLPRFFAAFQKRIEANPSGFIVGDKISIADFSVVSFAYGTFLNDLCPLKEQVEGVAKQFPKFYQYCINFGESQLKNHLETRKKYPG